VRGSKLSVVAATPPSSATGHGDRLREVLTTGLLMAEVWPRLAVLDIIAALLKEELTPHLLLPKKLSFASFSTLLDTPGLISHKKEQA
jgi:hypothetical protein